MHESISYFATHSPVPDPLLEKPDSSSSNSLLAFNESDTKFWLKGYSQYKRWNLPLAGASFTLEETGYSFIGNLNEDGVSILNMPSAPAQLSLSQHEKNYYPAEIFKVGNRPVLVPGNKVDILQTDYINNLECSADPDNLLQITPRVLEVTTLMPPIIVNLRTDARRNDPHARFYLLDNELEYFKKTGNATLFIHGFNVRYGHYKRQIEELCLIDHHHSAFPYQAKFSAAKSTVWRNKDRLLQNVKSHNLHPQTLLIPQEELTSERHLADDTWLNGEGVHNWFVHMEDNLNRATGKFNRDNYDQFTRLINIAWSGDIGLLNYMDAVANATESGRRLFSLINQLHQANIKINIIAHSLGCQVLMSLLQDLGKRAENLPELNEVIDHVFLWNPAIPDNAFSDSVPDTNFHYRFPKAHKATKKITVLSSQHDNILGPIPKDDKRILENVTDPSGGFLLTAICLAIDLLHRHPVFAYTSSIYNMANLMGISWSYMLESKENRQAYYQQWINTYPNMKTGTTFKKSLEEQKILIRNEYAICFHLISLAVMAYHQEKTIYLQTLIKMVSKRTLDDTLYPYGMLPRQLNILEKIPYVDDPVGNEIATLIISILISDGVKIRSAMGYAGYDRNDSVCKKMAEQGKIIQVDQTPWLFTHSGMKIPSEDLMQHIYKEYVMNPKKGIQHFGSYY